MHCLHQTYGEMLSKLYSYCQGLLHPRNISDKWRNYSVVAAIVAIAIICESMIALWTEGSELTAVTLPAVGDTTTGQQRLSSRLRIYDTEAANIGLQVMQLTDNIRPAVNGMKVVGLLEERNAEETLFPFLNSLSRIVDAIIVLDDHSSDNSMMVLIDCAMKGIPVEIMINVSAPWMRQELFHRQVLLKYGRAIGGTHFVLPDYDEYFSSNCVSSGLLRRKVLELTPGQSLYIPWVEPWKSPMWHRVLSNDPQMNFLIRRQIIIFADDKVVEYTAQSTGSRNLCPRTDNLSCAGTIHVLRCPRSICPAPLPYRGPESLLSVNKSVQNLPECRILEFRFLNLANALAKVAWYEAVGRIAEVGDEVTRGKMFDYVSPPEVASSGLSNRDVLLQPVNKDWLNGYDRSVLNPYSYVEVWRIHELLRLRKTFGDRRFFGLRAFGSVDLSRLQHALTASSRLPSSNQKIDVVPSSIVTGTFVVCAIDLRSGDRPLTEFLEVLGGVSVKVELELLMNETGSFENMDGKAPPEYVAKRITSLIRNCISSSKNSIAFWDLDAESLGYASNILELCYRDMAEKDIIMIMSSCRNVAAQRKVLELRSLHHNVFKLAMAPASNLRMFQILEEMLGSFSGVFVLCERILVRKNGESGYCHQHSKELLVFAESMHTVHRLSNMQSKSGRPPVARLIFSLNTGRSGSKYLASVLDSTGPRGILSTHEPKCPNNYCTGGGALAMQNRSLLLTYKDRHDVKVPMIRDAIASIPILVGLAVQSESSYACFDELFSAANCRVLYELNAMAGCVTFSFKDVVYSETNPNFKSWFFDVVLDTFPKSGYAVDIIVLRKYIPATVRSLIRTGYFETRNGYNWMETANSVNARIKALGSDDAFDAVDKVISYVLNAEAVTRHVMSLYKGFARFVEVRSEIIYGKTGALELINDLDLTTTWQTLRTVGRKVDKYSKSEVEKSKIAQLLSLRECEDRVKHYMLRCDLAGIALPDNLSCLSRVDGFEYD